MKNYALRFRYVYTFYSFDELMGCEAIDETFALSDKTVRFTLHQQEDSSFTVSPMMSGASGEYAVMTFPNKDNLVLRPGEEYEIAYDEFFDSMGDNNHNVYEGTVCLEEV